MIEAPSGMIRSFFVPRLENPWLSPRIEVGLVEVGSEKSRYIVSDVLMFTENQTYHLGIVDLSPTSSTEKSSCRCEKSQMTTRWGSEKLLNNKLRATEIRLCW